MSNYTIRKLMNTEFHLLIPLMKDCFGMNVNVEYFEWKFVKNPAGFVEGFVAVSDSGEIAAYYGVIPEFYIIDNKETVIYQSCDTMTHSSHRRKGLFQKLALHCYDYLQKENKLFVIGFSGEQSTPGFLKFGWVHVFNMKYYFFSKWFVLFKPSLNKKISILEDYNLIKDLILKSNTYSQIHSHKTMQVFNWRLSNPTFKYKVLAYQNKENRYNSYVCYYIMDNKIVLFDFYIGDIKSGKALVSELKRLLSKSKLKGIIAFVQEDSIYSRYLKRTGFISNPFSKGPLSVKTPFIFYTNPEDLNKYNVKEKWLVNSFDHDAM